MVWPQDARMLVYAALALVAAGLFVVWRRRRVRHDVPRAVALGRSWRRVAHHWPIAVAACGIAAATWIHLTWTDVIVVRDGGAAEHLVHVGTWQPFGDTRIDHPVWVVNESSRVVQVEIAHYGVEVDAYDDVAAPAPADIAPGEQRAEPRIDLIGPDDPPPSEIRAGDRKVAFRVWLTWKR